MDELRRIEIKESFSYMAIKTIAKYMDKYFLDPLIGLIPEVGDILTAVFSLPFFLYVTAVKVKSVPLTLAVTYNFLLDTLIGMIPFMIGNVLDFFSRANIKSFKLITLYIEGDKATVREVNGKAARMVLLIVLLCVAIYFMVMLVVKFAIWFYNLVRPGIDYLLGLFST